MLCLSLKDRIFLIINDVGGSYHHKMHFPLKILLKVSLTKLPGKINIKNISSTNIIFLLTLYSYIKHIEIIALDRYMPLSPKKFSFII